MYKVGAAVGTTNNIYNFPRWAAPLFTIYYNRKLSYQTNNIQGKLAHLEDGGRAHPIDIVDNVTRGKVALRVKLIHRHRTITT